MFKAYQTTGCDKGITYVANTKTNKVVSSIDKHGNIESNPLGNKSAYYLSIAEEIGEYKQVAVPAQF